MAEKTTGTPVSTRQRLPWSLILIFLLLTSAILVSGYLFFQKQKKDALHDQTANLQAIADLKSQQISRWLNERLGDARLILQNPLMVKELTAFINAPAPGEKEIFLHRWMESLRINSQYENILLLDRQGKVVITTNPQQVTFSGEVLEAIETARQRRDAVLSELHADQGFHIHLDVVAPLSGADGSAGFILLCIDPQQFLFSLIQSWPTASPSAETLLVRRQGDDVLFLNELRHRKNTALKLRLPLDRTDLPAAQAILGRQGIMRGLDYRGVPVWSVIRPIQDSPWFIVAKLDSEEIERPVRRSAQSVFLVTLILIMTAALMILFLWQHQKIRFRLNQLEERRQSEEKFRQVFETANVGKSITLPTGEVQVNQAFCDMLGYNKNELRKKTWQELTPADEVASIQEMLEPLLKGEKNTLRFNKRYIHKNGSYVWADVSVAIIRDQDCKPLHFITTIIDISERKRVGLQMEAVLLALKKSEAKFRLVLDATPFPIAVVDLQDDKINYWSRSAIELFGHTAATAAEWYEIAYPDPEYRQDVVKRWKPFLEKARATGRPVNTGEYQVSCRDGSVRICELYATFLEESLIVTFNDVSERKRAELDLQALSARNQALLEAVPDIIMEVDTNKVYTWANHSGIEFFGADVIGKEAADYFQGEQKVYQTVKPIFNGYEDIIYVESWQRRRDGAKRLLAWWCRVLKDEAGKVTGALSSARDITEIKLAENEIRRLNEELEQRVLLRTAQLQASNKELEAFSYSVSHDLRAPLRAISGFSQILLEEYAAKLDAEGRRLLDIITGNTGKMGHLIDDLLAFSRLSRQKMALAPVNLPAMAKVVFSELQSLEKDRKIEFKVGALPGARGDHAMLQQVLQNLLANAIKFTRTRKAARIELGGRVEKTESVFYVKDNGVGFDMKYVNKLFGVFQRLHGSDEFEGTGVGLAIVQRIVLRHGGRVWAESKGKGGATFYFSLPGEANEK